MGSLLNKLTASVELIATHSFFLFARKARQLSTASRRTALQDTVGLDFRETEENVPYDEKSIRVILKSYQFNKLTVSVAFIASHSYSQPGQIRIRFAPNSQRKASIINVLSETRVCLQPALKTRRQIV